MVDVVGRARRAADRPRGADRELDALEQATRVPGVLAVGALRRDDRPEALLATLTVMLTELAGPLEIAHFVPRDAPATVTSVQDQGREWDRINRVERFSTQSRGESQQPVRILLVHYLLESDGRLLTLAFSTPRPEMMSETGRELFEAIRRTASIQTEPGQGASPGDKVWQG